LGANNSTAEKAYTIHEGYETQTSDQGHSKTGYYSAKIIYTKEWVG